MELQQVIKYLESPEEVLAVSLQEELIDWTTFFIHTLEQEIADLDFKVDVKLDKLVETHGSVAAGEVKLRLEDVYRERKQKQNILKSLKSYRQNIRRKRDRIIPR